MSAQREALVLCYHGISDTWPSDLAISPQRLREQLAHLVRKGYAGATFTALVRGAVPGKALAVTFDDGYTSVLERALPILSEFGLPGTVFVTTEYVGRSHPMRWPEVEEWRGTEHAEELSCLDWDQLRGLQARGWEIGGHTRSHPRLTHLGPEELRDELTSSREEITRQMGRTCTSVAYPFGDYNDEVAEAAGEVGYAAGGIMRPGPLDPLQYPRVGIYPRDSGWRFRAKASPRVLRARNSILGRPIENRRQAALKRHS